MTGINFQKMENYFLKWRKITFIAATFLFLAYSGVLFFGFDYFLLNFDALLKFGKSQKFKVAAIWQSWRYYHAIWRHHFPLWTSKETSLDVLSILQASLPKLLYLRSYGGGGAEFPPANPLSPRRVKKPRLDRVKLNKLTQIYLEKAI